MADYLPHLLKGLARILHEKGVAVYRESTPYVAGEIPITFGALHPTADICVALTVYGDPPSPDVPLADVRIQARTRHPNYLDGLKLVDRVRTALHRQTHIDLDGVRVGQVLQISSGPLGRDEAGRHEWSQNLRITGLRPLT